MQKSMMVGASAVFLVVLFFVGVFVAVRLDSDFGMLDVGTVYILDDDKKLAALLYTPRFAGEDKPAPGVVLAHGIGASKEMMSSLGLELARRGFVSLCVDLLGHGESQGSVEEGETDPSFGVYSALQYLKSRSFVNFSAVGLIGHSLGAGAVRAAAMRDGQIGALVLIAGGLGEVAEGPEFGVFNATYPRNLMVVVGRYDVLLDWNELASVELPAVFGVQEVIPEVVYGDFSSCSARKFVVPNTTHLFEPLDSMVVSESVAWMEKSLGGAQDSPSQGAIGFVYPLREASVLLAFFGFLGLLFVCFFLIERFVQVKAAKRLDGLGKFTFANWRFYAVWGLVNIVLFVPLFGVGLVVSFPPLVFGSSVAWWMLGSGLVGLLLLGKFSQRLFGGKMNLKERLARSATLNGLAVALVVFVFAFVVVNFLGIFNFNFRIVTPIFRGFSSIDRFLVFFMFIPFFLAYFVAEGFYLHEFKISRLESFRSDLQSFGAAILGKIAPFAILLFLHYFARIAFGVWLFPNFIGFLFEFLWLIVPIFVIASSFSWWFFERTGNTFSGALFNALLMSWVASVVFPF